jgi:hypothetical protein
LSWSTSAEFLDWGELVGGERVENRDAVVGDLGETEDTHLKLLGERRFGSGRAFDAVIQAIHRCQEPARPCAQP